jgi:hypothetical protein
MIAAAHPTSASSAPVGGGLVQSVLVNRALAGIAVGQALQFGATLEDASWSTLTGQTIRWASAHTALATASGIGLVAGLGAGTATVSVTSGSTAITVTAPYGGGTILFQENFQDTAFASRGWYDNTSMAITSTVAGSTSALEVHFPTGATVPTWGGAARHLFQPSATVYVSYWVKYSANWVGSGQTYQPHEFLLLSSLDSAYSGLSDAYLAAYVEHNYQASGGFPVLNLQDSRNININYGPPPVNLLGVTENRSTSGCNGVAESQFTWSCFNRPPWYNMKTLEASQPTFLPNPGTGYKNNWNHVEAYFQLNSVVGGIGQSDGIMQYWFNGVLVMAATNVQFRTGANPTLLFNQFLIAPYIGAGSPADQYLWVANLTVATGKP